MTDEFVPDTDNTMTLYEVWQDYGTADVSLLVVQSAWYDLPALGPGDAIVKRTWVPSGKSEIVNQARPR